MRLRSAGTYGGGLEECIMRQAAAKDAPVLRSGVGELSEGFGLIQRVSLWLESVVMW